MDFNKRKWKKVHSIFPSTWKNKYKRKEVKFISKPLFKKYSKKKKNVLLLQRMEHNSGEIISL